MSPREARGRSTRVDVARAAIDTHSMPRRLVVVAVASVLLGCFGDVGPGGPGSEPWVPDGPVVPGDCATPEEMFADRVWPQVMDRTCIACHTAAGAASMSRLLLVRAGEDPGYLTTNFERVRALAAEHVPEADNRSLLELKPSGGVMHGGAVAIVPGGPQHQLLRDFVARLDGAMCDPTEEPPLPYPFYDSVTYVEPIALLRRVTLNLNGRLPTAAERAAVEAGGLDALGPIVDAIMEDDRFLDRLKEAFNDIFLTRGPMETGVLSYAYYPDRGWPSSMYAPPEIYRVDADYRRALYDEPVELIAHIVANDRPFTHILTANYTVVSPYTARGYGVFDDIRTQFTNENDPFEFIETRLPARTTWCEVPPCETRSEPTRDGLYPHAGLLSMLQFLVRYPSTDTNRNRGRARQFFQLFLGYDIMASAPAVTDAAAVTARFANPTLEAPDCVACHRALDPIAGLFQDYDNRGDYQFRDTPWFTDMFAPGYGMTNIPATEMPHALQWLGAQAAADPRFPIAMAEYAYYILTQERVMVAPPPGDPMGAAVRRGYDAQREAITDAADAMVAAGFDFKAAIRSLIFSDFYRANGVSVPVTDVRRRAELTVLGASALYTPEELTRNTRAIFGIELNLDPTYPYETGYMLYGGIDYLDVTMRTALPNGAMGALMRSHAHAIACTAALREFWDAGIAPTPLFPMVDEDTVDEARIRQNLVHLHDLVLGEELTVTAPEIDRSYALFDTVRTAGAARVTAGTESDSLPYTCRAEMPGVPDDRDYVMRAWQAVITYLVRRPEYLLHQ